MIIRDNILTLADGEDGELLHRETPNISGGGITPLYLIIHYTAGRDFDGSVDWLCSSESKASAHLVISREGQIAQLAPFNRKCWHAGVSRWKGHKNLNNYSIGIELDNAGILTKGHDCWLSWFQKEYDSSEVIEACHKFDQNVSGWHRYTSIQIEILMKVSSLLVGRYGLIDILGHDDIAPNRKKDPGPGFPMEQFKSAVMGRLEEKDTGGEENNKNLQPEILSKKHTSVWLNVRKGAGRNFGKVSGFPNPLPPHTAVDIYEENGAWRRITGYISGAASVSGWVSSVYLI